MAASPFTVTLGIVYTPPSAAANSGSSSFPLTGTYNALNAGQLDVTTATSPGAIVPIPFGSVAAAKGVIVKNLMSADVGIRLNGDSADTFQLAAGGQFMYVTPTAPATTPMSAVSVVVAAAPASTELIQFIVFGD